MIFTKIIRTGLIGSCYLACIRATLYCIMSPDSKPAISSDVSLSLALACIFLFILLPLIEIYPIGSSSEAREVHVAREIGQGADWLLPRRNGVLPSKPPLFHWLTAAIGTARGEVNEFSARFVSLLFATGTIFLTCLMAIKLIGNRYTTALLSALILGSSYEFVRLAGDARVDMTFCFFVTLSISSMVFPFGIERQKFSLSPVLHRQNDFVLFYVAAIFAVLSKGPLGIVLPFIAGFSITWQYYGFRKAVALWSANRTGLYLFILVTPLWYFFAHHSAGNEFLTKQLLFENIGRFTGDEYSNNEPVWYYFPSFLRSAFPWSALLIYLVAQNAARTSRGYLRKNSTVYASGQASGTVYNITLVWFFSGFLFFSAASGKRHSYLVPLFPAMTLLLTARLQALELLSVPVREHLKEALVMILFLCSLIFMFGFETYQVKSAAGGIIYNWFQGNQSLIVFACLSVFILKMVFRVTNRTLYWQRDVVLLTAVFALVALPLSIGMGIKNSLKEFRSVAEKINHLVQAGDLYAVREKHEELLDPVLFYLNRDIQIFTPQSVSPVCNAYYLLQDEHQAGFLNNKRMKKVMTFLQPIDLQTGRKDRALHIFRYDCQSGSSQRDLI